MLWFLWIMATSVGWVLGRLLLPNLALVTVGLAIGILQWFVLQRRFKKAWQWILATTAGYALGSLISNAAIPQGMDFLAALLIGLTTGSAQWLILRREVQWAGWWIVINIIAWTTGLAFLPGLFSTGALVGLITATALALLLNVPKQVSAPDSEQTE
jgi:predicted branched-subunit amino acid permease